MPVETDDIEKDLNAKALAILVRFDALFDELEQVLNDLKLLRDIKK